MWGNRGGSPKPPPLSCVNPKPIDRRNAYNAIDENHRLHFSFHHSALEPCQPVFYEEIDIENTKGLWPHIVRIAAIAAIYAVLTIVCNLVEGSLSWGPVQLRLSEVLCVLAIFTYDAIPGLAIGCGIANIVNLSISGLGAFTVLDFVYSMLVTLLGSLIAWRFRDHPIISYSGLLVANIVVVAIIRSSLGTLGVLDVVFGSLASAIAAGFAWHYRDRIEIAVAGPVIANALIIPFFFRLCSREPGSTPSPSRRFPSKALIRSWSFSASCP